ncbi:AraC family transcriptional regulator [Neorhizobium huautlense]|uniref:AraC family transcriptional regulator n=1 Tax=Neorhizobium huautlense TaxID=67774 RepID=UPI000CF84115|nr:AraC family transcriptional regulator [Neorhizobium huautlense]
MLNDHASAHTAPHSGSTFETMVATLSNEYGALDALPDRASRSFYWKADCWTVGTVSLFSGEFENGWRLSGCAEAAQWLSIIWPKVGVTELDVGNQAIRGKPGDVLLAHNRQVKSFNMLGSGHRYEALRLDWTAIARAVPAIFETPLVDPLQLETKLDLSNQSGQMLVSVAKAMAGGMRHNGPLLRSPLAVTNLSSAMADIVLRTVPHRLSHLLEKKVHLVTPAHVRHAIDFMHAKIGSPLTIFIVADAVGVSVRTLENAFRVFKDTTPATYLRTIRLKAARRDLLDPLNTQSVKDICLKWGFFHFGRFSAVYRASYGESPKETRVRVRKFDPENL